MSTSLDPKVIGKLAEILDKNNLTGIEYEDEGCHITLSRNIQMQATPVVVPQAEQPGHVVQEAAPAFDHDVELQDLQTSVLPDGE